MKVRTGRYLEPITAGAAALAIGTQVASGLGNQAMGLIGQKAQLRGQKKALEQQNNANYDFWLKTNYGAQKEQLKAAGLNPGLIYGMGGGAGGQTGGASAMPTAQQGSMDIASAMQLALLQAQKDNIESSTEKNRAEAAATAGVNTDKARTEIESIKQNMKNAQAQEALTKVQTSLAKLDEIYQGDTLENRIGKLQDEKSILGQELRSISAQADIDVSTKETVIKAVNVELLQKVLQLEATRQGISESKARIGLMSEQGRAVLASIQQGYNREIEAGKSRNDAEANTAIKWQMAELEKMTGIPTDIIKTVIGAGILKGIMEKGRTVVEGFKR